MKYLICLKNLIISTYLANMLIVSTFASLPPISELTTSERVLMLELSRDVVPDVNDRIAKLQALDRSDFNHDGMVDLQDFAVFAADYSLFADVGKMPTVKEPEPLKIYADFNDPCFVNYYLNEYMESK